MSLKPENIPQELRNTPRWVLWRSVDRGGKKTKIPYRPDGSPARVNHPGDCSSFESVLDAYQRGGFDGIGFVLLGDGYTVIDLDACLDENGTPNHLARRVLSALQSYAERSPSGKGVHIFVKGKLPPAGRRSRGIEMYDSGRYVTVTGDALPGSPAEIAERQTELLRLHTALLGPAARVAQEILSGKHGPLLKALFNGDWRSLNKYASESEADLAFCRLASRLGLGAEDVDALYRLSGLFDSKWDAVHSADGLTYGEMTLGKVFPEAPSPQTPAGAGTDLAAQLLAQAQDHARWVLSAPPLEAIWEGLVYRGCVHLWASPPKGGKSTVLNHLLERLCGPETIELTVGPDTYCLQDGTFLGCRFRGWQRVLLITENPAQFWQLRPPLPGVLTLSAFAVRSAGPGAVPALIATGLFDLIVLDTFDKVLPLRDENSNAEIAEALSPIIEAAHASGVAVILVHHHRKGGGSRGEEVRGGSALFGAVDEYISLIRRDDPDDLDGEEPMRMTLSPSGRLSPPRKIRFLCTLFDAWLESEDPQAVSAEEKVLGALRESEEPLSRKQIEEATGLSAPTVKRVLKSLVDAGSVVALGDQRSRRYSLPPEEQSAHGMSRS